MKRTLVACTLLLMAGCTQKNEIVVPVNGDFSNKIKPIFDRSCSGSSCHGGGSNGYAVGLDLSSYDGLFRGYSRGTAVVSGSPFMSVLVQCINRTDSTISPISSARMPAGRDPLPDEDVQTIVQWIRDGARDDDGALPFPDPRPLGKVFFTSQFTDLVGAIDIQTGLIMRYTNAGNVLPFNQPPQSPHNVQVDDQGKYYYVTLIRGNKLRKYDAVTNQMLAEVPAGSSPAHVVITSDGSKAYVTNFDQSVGQVYEYNTATMAQTNIITVPNFMKATHGARLSHDGKFLYIGNNGTDLVTIISTANDSIVAHVPVALDVPPFGSFSYKPYQIAVRGDDRYIYVTNNGRASVSVLRRDSNDVFTFQRTIPVGQKPLQCEVTRDGRFLYVCNQGSGSVSVIDAQTNDSLTTIENVGKQPHGIDITDDSRTVYVTLENILNGEPPHHPIAGSKDPAFIAVINVASNTVIRKIEVGGFAAGISIYPGRGN